MSNASLRVSVPVCSFRKPYAREYLESERVPPPATVYGFLLSLVGEEDRYIYSGTRLAIAMTKKPEISSLIRTAWRIKDKNTPPGKGNNRRPDYQEVLTGLELFVWVYKGELSGRLLAAGCDPGGITRYGGLSLGESRDLVDEVVFSPLTKGLEGFWLVSDDHGQYPLTVWVDHVGSKGTNWGQFKLQQAELKEPGVDDQRWIAIQPANRK